MGPNDELSNQLQVKWFLGKKEIKNGSKYNIVNKHHLASLEIYDLVYEDAGEIRFVKFTK